MSVAIEISRIQTDRNTIRAKLVELGLAQSSATAIEGIENRGSVSANVKEGETYTIPKGYHNGSGTVSGVAGGGSYNLQSKTVTPTKLQQNVIPDPGHYGLSDVTVGAIPEGYQDVTAVTALPKEVLTGKIYVDATGKVTPGEMPNNGAVSKTLTPAEPSYTVPEGYHDGKGVVKVTTEEKTATPTKASQSITPTSGKVLSKVTVEAIPEKFQDISVVTAGGAQVLDGYQIVNALGQVEEGEA